MAISKKSRKQQPVKVVAPFLTDEINDKAGLKALLQQEEIIEDFRFNREVTDLVNRPYLTIRNGIFNHQIFFECLFKSAQISDVRFENCDLSNISLTGSSLHRVEFISCKLLGANLSEVTLNHVRMHECNAQYINLSMSKVTQTKFSQCDFQHGSFNDNKLSGIVFEHCRLQESDFSHTSLRGIDLSTSGIERLSLHIADLRGAVIGVSQVMDIIPLLGVVVRDFDPA